MEASEVLPFYQLLFPVSWKLLPFSCTVCRGHVSHQVAGFLFEHELLRASNLSALFAAWSHLVICSVVAIGGSSTTQGASAGSRRQNARHLSVDISIGKHVVFLWQLTALQAHHLHPEEAEQLMQFPSDGTELIMVHLLTL